MKSLHAFKEKTFSNESKLEESVVDSATVKILPSGRKSRSHRLKIGDVARVRDETEEDDGESKKENIKENITSGEPPFVLVLKRKAYRLYPNNLRVALYYNDKLNKYFSVPYVDSGRNSSVIQAEELNNSVIDTLKTIVETKVGETIILENNETVYVDFDIAYAITKVYDELNEENKQKMGELVEKTSLDFNKVATFSLSKLK